MYHWFLAVIYGVWRNWLARCVRVAEVLGSNPSTPTMYRTVHGKPICLGYTRDRLYLAKLGSQGRGIIYSWRKYMVWKTFIIRTFANILIIGGFVILGATYLPIITGEAWYYLKTVKKQEYSLDVPNGEKPSIFARYLSANAIKIEPINKTFSIVIEKIDVSAPIVENVSVIDPVAYNKALDTGVAHAAGSALPGENGNVYLFAHSSLGFFRFSKYATVFNLLRKLQNGDKIHVFYQNRDYLYQVINKETVKGWNTVPLTRKVIQPTLTLQTCDPPGTTFNRLVVTAKLLQVR